MLLSNKHNIDSWLIYVTPFPHFLVHHWFQITRHTSSFTKNAALSGKRTGLSLPGCRAPEEKYSGGKLEGNIGEQNYISVESWRVAVTSPVQNRNRLEWTRVKERQRWCSFFLVPTRCVLALMRVIPSSPCAAHLLPGELAGEAGTPSLPEGDLPLHFPAQTHRVHHCSACSHGEAIQAALTSLHPCWDEHQGHCLV